MMLASSTLRPSSTADRGRLIVQLTALILLLLVHQSHALNVPRNYRQSGIALQTSSSFGKTRTSPIRLKMIDEHFYDPYFSNEESMNQNEYYRNDRGQSWLSQLAQQSQHRQPTHFNSNDLQSTLNQELDMMEAKLLQFQESSSKRSQELLDQLEVFSRQEGFRRRGNRVNAASASTDGPFFGRLENDVESE